MARALYNTPNKILAAAREYNISRSEFRQVPGVRALPVLDRIFDAFTTRGYKNRSANWFWDDLREPQYSLQRPVELDVLLALGSPTTPVWLIVEGSRKRYAFWVFEATLDSARRTLDNYHYIEFYLASKHFDWLVAVNHHDALVAVGEPAITALQRLEGR